MSFFDEFLLVLKGKGLYFGTKILDMDLLKSHSRNEVLVLVL